jgi:hypothetical protein
MVANASVTCDNDSSKLEGRSGTTNVCLTYPQKEKSMGIKSGYHGGQKLHCERSAPIYDSMTGRISKKLWYMIYLTVIG